MALSKEEIAVRVGIDASTVGKSLDTFNSRLRRWASSQKNMWDDAVKHHAEAEKKKEEAEVKAAVRAAERSNQARKLLRERAAKREAKEQQGPSLADFREYQEKRSEIELQAAITSAERSNKARRLWRERAEKREIRDAEIQAKKIEAANDTWINRVYSKAEKKLSGIGVGIAAGIAAQAASIVSDIISRAFDFVTDKATETFANLYYGVSSAKTSAVESQSNYWKDIREAQKGLMSEKEKFKVDNAARNFEDADQQGKIVLLEKEAEIKSEAHDRARADFEWVKKNSSNQTELLKKEAEMYRTLNELSAVNFHLKKQTNSLDEEGKIKFAERKLKELDAKNKEVYEARKEIKALEEEIKSGSYSESEVADMRARISDLRAVGASVAGERSKYNEMLNAGAHTNSPLEASQNSLTPLQKVSDYMAKIKSAQDAYKDKTDYSQFGKAVAEAQAKAAAETVIPVRIVEIKD